MAKLKLVPELEGVGFAKIITSTKQRKSQEDKLKAKIQSWQKESAQRKGFIYVYEDTAKKGEGTHWKHIETIEIPYEHRFRYEVGDQFENDEGELVTLVENIVKKEETAYNRVPYDRYYCKVEIDGDLITITEYDLSNYKKINEEEV